MQKLRLQVFTRQFSTWQKVVSEEFGSPDVHLFVRHLGHSSFLDRMVAGRSVDNSAHHRRYRVFNFLQIRNSEVQSSVQLCARGIQCHSESCGLGALLVLFSEVRTVLSVSICILRAKNITLQFWPQSFVLLYVLEAQSFSLQFIALCMTIQCSSVIP